MVTEPKNRILLARAVAIVGGAATILSFLVGCKNLPPPRPVQAAVQDSGGLLMKEQAAYDVQHYDLSLQIDPARKSIAGTGTIEVKVLEAMSWLVLDLDPRLKVSRVRVWSPSAPAPGKETGFEQRGLKLWVALNPVAPAGSRVTAAIDYAGCPREAVRAPWDGGFTWARTKSGQPWIATSVQGEGADLWWPCKDHPSDKPESFTLRIRVPRPLVVAGRPSYSP